MAKRTIHVLVDDIDGGDADETLEFAVDGTTYTIDLSKSHAEGLRAALRPYVNAGTRLGRGPRAMTAFAMSRRPASAPQPNRDQNRAIREWATAKGIPVAPRGRVKQDIVDRFNAEAGK